MKGDERVLQIVIPEREYYDEKTEMFIATKGATLQLEHSLVSISKWESKWHKPWLQGKNDTKTTEETMSYIQCMTITQNVDPLIYTYIPGDIFRKIEAYIDDKMTATWFTEDQKTITNSEIITSEIIYHWMIKFSIPVEFQKWHLNRLLTLVRVCVIKSQPKKKRNRTFHDTDMMAERRALNEARRAQFNSEG